MGRESCCRKKSRFLIGAVKRRAKNVTAAKRAAPSSAQSSEEQKRIRRSRICPAQAARERNPLRFFSFVKSQGYRQVRPGIFELFDGEHGLQVFKNTTQLQMEQRRCDREWEKSRPPLPNPNARAKVFARPPPVECHICAVRRTCEWGGPFVMAERAERSAFRMLVYMSVC